MEERMAIGLIFMLHEFGHGGTVASYRSNTTVMC